MGVNIRLHLWWMPRVAHGKVDYDVASGRDFSEWDDFATGEGRRRVGNGRAGRTGDGGDSRAECAGESGRERGVERVRSGTCGIGIRDNDGQGGRRGAHVRGRGGRGSVAGRRAVEHGVRDALREA